MSNSHAEKVASAVEQEGLLNERIESERLVLVPISMQYADDVLNEFSEEITALMYPAPLKSVSEAEAFVETSREGLRNKSNLQMVILMKDSLEFLGCAGLHHVDTRTPELGVWVKKSAHEHGYGKEAVAAMKAWADTHLDYDYLRYPVDERNISSRRIPESLGGIVDSERDEKGMGGNELHLLEYRIYPERG